MTDNIGYVVEHEEGASIQLQNGKHIDDIAIDLNEDPIGVEKAKVEDDPTRNQNTIDLLYTISDTPPWYLCIFLGLQHYLTAFGGMLSLPLILAPAFCLGPNDVGTAEILSTLIFVSGMVTLLQTTLGTRLPILQGGTFSFLVPTFAILSLPKWQCQKVVANTNITLYNGTTMEPFDEDEQWHSRIREIQGAIILSSLFQVVIGASGVLGIMLNYIGPLAIVPTITLVGLALFKPAANECAGQWWISIATIICILIFSQLINKYDIPCYKVSKGSKGNRRCMKWTSFPFLNVFPMLLSICLMWVICYILTITDTLPTDPDKWGHKARTDSRIEVLNKAKWFRFPYPFQWGLPTFSAAGAFGMLAGVLAGIVESVGDYYACARLSGAPPPPVHAINRGILIEGIGCILAGMWGTGNGTTSYSENIGAIGITRVGSRIVIQTAGLIMILLGMLGKFGALFVTIPEPVVGGVFMVTFGMITAVGMSNLQYVTMNSSRNLFIVGLSLFFGLSMPEWMSSHHNTIHTGVPEIDQILTVLLSTGMFVGGVVGFTLDNIIPGSEEERGLKAWRNIFHNDDAKEMTLDCYDFPWCMGCISRVKFFRYFPICPTFNYSPSSSSCCRKANSYPVDTPL